MDLVFSFDTTGSMNSVLDQVRKVVKETLERLLKDIPHLRIGVIAHGDYCDKDKLILKHDLDTNIKALSTFVTKAPSTGGGDTPEAYELVLRDVQGFSWKAGNKILVLIGDAYPHEVADNPERIDWKNETQSLADMGVKIYSVQCGGDDNATNFFKSVAQTTGGIHLQLAAFSEIVDCLMGIAFHENSDEQRDAFEEEVKKSGRMAPGLQAIFRTLSGRETESSTSKPAPKRGRAPAKPAASTPAPTSPKPKPKPRGKAAKRGAAEALESSEATSPKPAATTEPEEASPAPVAKRAKPTPKPKPARTKPTPKPAASKKKRRRSTKSKKPFYCIGPFLIQ